MNKKKKITLKRNQMHTPENLYIFTHKCLKLKKKNQIQKK